MSDKGFIVIDRKIINWKWWGNTYAMSIWLYILMGANWKDGYWAATGEEVKRGSFITSVSKISSDLGLNRRTIKHWLNAFKTDGQIDYECTTRYTRITVIKYGFYQDLGNDSAQPSAQPSAHNRTKKQRNHNNQVTNNKYSCSSDDERSLSDAHKKAKKSVLSKQQTLWFTEFWSAYPRKTGKLQAEKAFAKACRNDTDIAAIMYGLSEQCRLKFEPMAANGEAQYIPYPSTWLNGRRWEDDLEPYTTHPGDQDDLPF